MAIDVKRAQEDFPYLKRHTKMELLDHISQLYGSLKESKERIEFLARCEVKPEDRVINVQTKKKTFAVNAEELNWIGDAETGLLVLSKEGIGTVAVIPGREILSVHNVLAADVWDRDHNRDDIAKVARE